MKDWLLTTCKAMIVSQIKQHVLDAGTQYQIGGLPGPQVVDHLITLKAIISRTIITGGGAIIILVYIKTFFYSKSGFMDSLYSAGVPMKLYRTWFKVNAMTVMSVPTPTGTTQTKQQEELCA